MDSIIGLIESVKDNAMAIIVVVISAIGFIGGLVMVIRAVIAAMKHDMKEVGKNAIVAVILFIIAAISTTQLVNILSGIGDSVGGDIAGALGAVLFR